MKNAVQAVFIRTFKKGLHGRIRDAAVFAVPHPVDFNDFIEVVKSLAGIGLVMFICKEPILCA